MAVVKTTRNLHLTLKQQREALFETFSLKMKEKQKQIGFVNWSGTASRHHGKREFFSASSMGVTATG